MSVVGTGRHNAGVGCGVIRLFVVIKGQGVKVGAKGDLRPFGLAVDPGDDAMAADIGLMFNFILAENPADKTGTLLFVFGEFRVAVQMPTPLSEQRKDLAGWRSTRVVHKIT